MEAFEAPRTYVPSPFISQFLSKVRVQTIEGHLLRPSFLTHASVHFDYSGKVVRLPNSSVRSLLIGEVYYKVTLIPHLYKFFRGAIKQAEFNRIMAANVLYVAVTKVTENKVQASSPPTKLDEGPFKPGYVIKPLPHSRPVSQFEQSTALPKKTSVVTQMTDPMNEILMKLSAIEAKISQPKSPRKSRGNRTRTLPSIKFVSSSDEDESTLGAVGGVPPTEETEKKRHPDCLSDDSCSERKSVFVPYDDTYDRMAAGYRRKGIRFLKAINILLNCNGSRSYAINSYQLRSSAYDVVLTSGYRITPSTTVQRDALTKILEVNKLSLSSIDSSQIYQPLEDIGVSQKLSDEQLHYCCMHP